MPPLHRLPPTSPYIIISNAVIQCVIKRCQATKGARDCEHAVKKAFYLNTIYFAAGGEKKKDMQSSNFVLTGQDQFQLRVRTSAQCVEMESMLSICVH